MGNVRRDIFKNKRLSDAEIDQIRHEVNVDTAVESMRNMTEENTNNENCEPVVDAQNFNDNEIQELINDIRNSENVNLEADVTELFAEQYNHEIKHAHKEIVNQFSRTSHLELSDREPLPKLACGSKLNESIKVYNVALKEILSERECDLTSLNALVYSTAKATTAKVGVKVNMKKNYQVNKPPKWKVKIQKEIDLLRAEISILNEVSKGANLKTRKLRKIKRKYKISDEKALLSTKESLKQRTQVKAQRSRRFDKRDRFYRQNEIFQTDARKFYRQIGKGKIDVKEHPEVKEIEKFWNNICGSEKQFNHNAEWMERQKERTSEVDEQQWERIDSSELRVTLGKSQKWKSPGIDKIPNFGSTLLMRYMTILHFVSHMSCRIQKGRLNGLQKRQHISFQTPKQPYTPKTTDQLPAYQRHTNFYRQYSPTECTPSLSEIQFYHKSKKDAKGTRMDVKTSSL